MRLTKIHTSVMRHIFLTLMNTLTLLQNSTFVPTLAPENVSQCTRSNSCYQLMPNECDGKTPLKALNVDCLK